jgi:hypothetical protein
MSILHVTSKGKQDRKNPNLQHQQIEPIYKRKPDSCPETISVTHIFHSIEKDRIG